MNLEEKFKNGFDTFTYQRVDAEYKVNTYLGYNDYGQMSMVITEIAKPTSVDSSKYISVSLNKREDGKLALTFDLLDNTYKQVFLVFCKDIIDACEIDGCDQAISNALKRWKYWKELFGIKRNSILEKKVIKGLIGEMLELRDFFMENYSEHDAISCWMGPFSDHKDFEIGNTWYEVKSAKESAIDVEISSFEQLESDVDGHLTVIRLEETSPASDYSININDLVSEIKNKIIDVDNLILFQMRLDHIGYTPEEEYENYCYALKGRQCYRVTDEFPRIRRSSVSNAIGEIKYKLLLDAIDSFKEE